MQLQITKDINLKNYSATFEIIDITNADTIKLDDYGLLRINVGGDIPVVLADGTLTTFKMSEEIKELPKDFPFTKTFKDIQYNGDAERYATAYIEEIKLRAKTLIDELNAKQDTFSGVEIFQL